MWIVSSTRAAQTRDPEKSPKINPTPLTQDKFGIDQRNIGDSLLCLPGGSRVEHAVFKHPHATAHTTNAIHPPDQTSHCHPTLYFSRSTVFLASCRSLVVLAGETYTQRLWVSRGG